MCTLGSAHAGTPGPNSKQSRRHTSYSFAPILCRSQGLRAERQVDSEERVGEASRSGGGVGGEGGETGLG